MTEANASERDQDTESSLILDPRVFYPIAASVSAMILVVLVLAAAL